MSLPFRIMALLAGAMLVFVVVGLILPGTWSAERSMVVEAAPGRIYPLLASPARWDAWTPWEDLESSLEGPTAGPGARRVWSDQESGSGSLEITGVVPDREVRYRVEVEGGIRIRGRLVLEPVEEGVRIRWTEEGEFGWNPLLSYLALGMERAQGAEMEKGLERLGEAATGSVPEVPGAVP